MPWFTNSSDDDVIYNDGLESFEIETTETRNVETELTRLREYIEQRNFRLEPHEGSETARAKLRWHNRAGFTPNTGISPGKTINDMPARTTASEWIVDEALEQLDGDSIGEAYAGNTYDGRGGIEGVAWRLCEEASSEISERVNNGHPSDSEAFNEVANGWPYEARCLLAMYEYASRRDEMGDRYESDVQSVVENVDIDNKMNDGWQTQLDWEFSANPFRDDELSTTEAETVMVVAANRDEITRDQLHEIDDHGIFRERYNETENVQVALDISAFDSDVSRSVLSAVARPGDWPSELDPGNIRSETCGMCGGLLHEVCTTPGEVTWIHERGGAEIGAIDLEYEDTDFYSPNNNAAILCGDCHTQFTSATKPTISLIQSDSDTPATFDAYQGIWRAVNDVSPAELSENGLSILTNLFHSGEARQDSFHTITPNGTLGNRDVQRQAILEMMDAPTPIDGGPVFIHHYEGEDPTVNIVKTNVETVTEVKRYIVDAVEDNQPQQAGV